MLNKMYSTTPYTLNDYDFVYNTKKTVYKQYVQANWGEWNEEKQQEMFNSFIDEYSKDIVIIIKDNHKIGFYHGENIDNNNYEIGNICILPEFQGQGIGTTILKNIISQHNTKNIHLQFFKQNPVKNLYLRLGFEIIEELPYHFKMILKQH